MSSLLNFVIKHKKYDEKPIKLVPQYKENEREPSILPTNYKAFLKSAKQDPELLAFAIIAGLTSKRTSEVLGLRYDRIVVEDFF